MLTTILALCMCTPIAAQTPADKDAEIARLKKTIEEMKAAQPAVAPAPTPAPTARPAPRTSSFQPGWIVSVVPATANGRQEEEIGKFVVKPEGFSYGDYRARISHPGWAKLKGIAMFNAAEAGRYVFVVRISWDPSTHTSYAMTCRTQLSVNDAELVGGEGATLKQVSSNRTSDRTFQAGVDLEKGAVPIAFEASCYIDNGMDNNDRVFNNEPSTRAWFDNIRFRFAVRGPDDMAPRQLNNNELVYQQTGSSTRAAPRTR